MLRPFVKALKPGAVEEWTAHAIQGRVQIHACVIDDHHFDFALVSRRSCKRAGKQVSVCMAFGPAPKNHAVTTRLFPGYRYQRRGLDSAGDVANFVETEQVVFFEDGEGPHVLSFVQTRGSSMRTVSGWLQD